MERSETSAGSLVGYEQSGRRERVISADAGDEKEFPITINSDSDSDRNSDRKSETKGSLNVSRRPSLDAKLLSRDMLWDEHIHEGICRIRDLVPNSPFVFDALWFEDSKKPPQNVPSALRSLSLEPVYVPLYHTKFKHWSLAQVTFLEGGKAVIDHYDSAADCTRDAAVEQRIGHWLQHSASYKEVVFQRKASDSAATEGMKLIQPLIY